MPEYLAPDVYVEEIDTGSKPIEGVSTSTAGMLGVTERGPVNVPILVTSYGEYVRWFGETLSRDVFGSHCFLPHAVEGFFANGGKRLFVVRVLDPSRARASETMLFDRAAVAGAVTSLLTPVSAAAPGTNTVYVVSGAGLAAPSWVQVGDGSNAEFRQITGVPAANHVSLRTPLQTSHLAGVLVDRIPLATVTGTAPSATPALDLEAAPGASTIRVSGPGAIAPGTVIRLGSIAGGDDEYVVASAVSAAAPAARDVSLSSRVQFLHPGGGGNTVDVMAAASFPVVAPGPDQQALSQDSPAGASVVFIANSANFLTAQDFVRIVDGASTEIRRIGALSALTLASSAYGAYAAGSAVDMVNLTLGPARNLAENATANSSVINVVDRTGLNIGDVVQIGPTADPLREILTIVDLPSRQTAPDAGGIVLSSPLRTAKTAPSEVRLVTAIARAAVPTTVLATPGSLGSASLIVTGGNLITAPSVLRIVSGTSSVYHVLNAVGPTAAAPVTLDSVLQRPHLAGEAVTARAPLLSVRALDQGGWGDRLRVAIRDNDPPLVKTKIRDMPPDTVHLKLESANGVEEGTVLKRMSPAGVVVSQHKVIGIDRQSDFLITLDPATPLPMGVASGDQVLSHEFQLDVFLMRQPDPAVPTRAENVLMTESYPFLSMDPRHSRYIHKVIGTTWTVSPPATQDDETEPGPNPLRKSDRRSQGLSWLIRVHDVETVAANRRAIRLGPTPLEDVLPGGTRRPSRLPLSGGSDAVGSIIDKTFIGTSDVEPELRTGMFALENEEDISIVAVPGEIDRSVQGALITHCELLRYRFAVLDGPRPPNDTLADAQAQRQQFDTKYAAFYHPWILIPEPYPANLAKVADYPVPPSGHMLGVYARTDIDRGVHKAPANEVVRGIIGLQRRLNKSEHDILNPYPVNINVIRDFRENSRGIRVYGGRAITSDPDWKYVNVRRLMIFIEASINRGLQWVVFEPNSEPLWARVRRSIANFLTLVWRNGALEGTKVEEAFFVKCDRTTMTQTDIDSGRLICYVGVAPVKPAEFVIVRIGLWTAHADD